MGRHDIWLCATREYPASRWNGNQSARAYVSCVKGYDGLLSIFHTPLLMPFVVVAVIVPSQNLTTSNNLILTKTGQVFNSPSVVFLVGAAKIGKRRIMIPIPLFAPESLGCGLLQPVAINPTAPVHNVLMGNQTYFPHQLKNN